MFEADVPIKWYIKSYHLHFSIESMYHLRLSKISLD